MKSKHYPSLWELKHKRSYYYRKRLAGWNGMWDHEHKSWLFIKQYDFLHAYAMCEEKPVKEVLKQFQTKDPDNWTSFVLPETQIHYLSEYV